MTIKPPLNKLSINKAMDSMELATFAFFANSEG